MFKLPESMLLNKPNDKLIFHHTVTTKKYKENKNYNPLLNQTLNNYTNNYRINNKSHIITYKFSKGNNHQNQT